jgi:flagellar hook-associated protein 1 FlgK
VGTLSASLNIALSSLSANDGAITTTSNNIANANTPGYARQISQFEETAPVLASGVAIGTGVTLGRPQTVRDNVLQLRITQEAQQGGQLDSFLSSMSQVQTLFNEASGTGLQQPLSAFFNSLQQLSTDPSNLSLRQGVISAGQNLASAFHQVSSGLSAQQQNLNLGVRQTVGQINELTTQIAGVNEQVGGLVAAGLDASAFISQRDVLLRKLSNLIQVNQTDAGNGTVTLTTGEGTPLVVGGQSYDLAIRPDPASGMQQIYSQGTNITSQITSGELGGQLQVRDQQIPSVLSNLDDLAFGISSSFNTQSQAGFDLNGAAGGDLFIAPPASVAGSANSFGMAITDPSLIAASSDGTAGSNGNLNALVNLSRQGIVKGQTPLSYYSSLIFGIGNAISNATIEQSSVKLISQQLVNQRGALSGVSLDEEAANLVKFQQAYEASARVITIISDLTLAAVNLGKD